MGTCPSRRSTVAAARRPESVAGSDEDDRWSLIGVDQSRDVGEVERDGVAEDLVESRADGETVLGPEAAGEHLVDASGVGEGEIGGESHTFNSGSEQSTAQSSVPQNGRNRRSEMTVAGALRLLDSISPRVQSRRDFRFYAVWKIRKSPQLAGIHFGPHPAPWNYICAQIGSPGYTPSLANLRRAPSLMDAVELYLSEIERHQLSSHVRVYAHGVSDQELSSSRRVQ